jgi:ABC-2 type transport system ATP-binding protein
MITVTNLVKRYGSFEAVHGVSFTVGEGRVVGLLGPNGAGKTTIMRVLTGYHRQSEGAVLLDGKDVLEDPVAVKSMVGYLPEGVPLYPDMTVAEYLGFVAEARCLEQSDREAAVARVVESCGLTGFADVRIERLSKGYRQRVGLAQAIIHDPAILILDEPTTGLDPNQILEIRQLIRSLGASKTVILSTHILQEVEALCSEVLILNEGRIVAQGSAAQIAADLHGDERLECVFKGVTSHISSILATLPSIRSVDSIDASESGLTRVSIIVDYGEAEHAAEAVFDWAVSSGAKILEMRRERLSMEDIFVRLTTEEDRL